MARYDSDIGPVNSDSDNPQGFFGSAVNYVGRSGIMAALYAVPLILSGGALSFEFASLIPTLAPYGVSKIGGGALSSVADSYNKHPVPKFIEDETRMVSLHYPFKRAFNSVRDSLIPFGVLCAASAIILSTGLAAIAVAPIAAATIPAVAEAALHFAGIKLIADVAGDFLFNRGKMIAGR